MTKLTNKHKINMRDQKVAADILTEFAFVNNMDEFWSAYNNIFKRYNLGDDPFTNLPVSTEEYGKNKLSYEKQTMIELYGHCDGFTEDDFNYTCREICNRFICPNCTDNTDCIDCDYDKRYCVDKLVDYFKEHEIVRVNASTFEFRKRTEPIKDII